MNGTKSSKEILNEYNNGVYCANIHANLSSIIGCILEFPYLAAYWLLAKPIVQELQKQTMEDIQSIH